MVITSLALKGERERVLAGCEAAAATRTKGDGSGYFGTT
jgi:hypothetical protein